MSTYRVKVGHGEALIDLVVLSPQPRSEGLKYTRSTHSASGLVYREGPYIELEWNVVESRTAYLALLTAFGLNAATSANVTLYALDEQLVATRYNGRAVRPEIGRTASQRDYFVRDVAIVIKDLVAL